MQMCQGQQNSREVLLFLTWDGTAPSLAQPTHLYLNRTLGLSELPFSPVTKGYPEAMKLQWGLGPHCLENSKQLFRDFWLAAFLLYSISVKNFRQPRPNSYLISNPPDLMLPTTPLPYCFLRRGLSFVLSFCFHSSPPHIVLFPPHPLLFPLPLPCSDKVPKKPNLILTDIHEVTDNFYLYFFSIAISSPFLTPLTPLRNMQAR